MSNIYIQEPPTYGKVLLITTVGDIDIELWSKETPKASRNFVQLAMEGYYNSTTFHRIVKGFIAQGGDPTGTGLGGESIYGEPFKDEFHSRLRFCRRGLVAMANFGKDDNRSQFFFTFAPCPELQNKHTIFGKVTGETIYNMIKLEEAVTDENETPLYPQKIIRAEILHNPFEDIVPRCLPEKKREKKIKKKRKSIEGVKNFKLLSFGEEAAEDEEESREASLSLAKKGKSTHDVLKDPNLSSKSVMEEDGDFRERLNDCDDVKMNVEDVRAKLKRRVIKDETVNESRTAAASSVNTEDSGHEENKTDKKKKKLEEIAEEIRTLKRDYQKNRKSERRKESQTTADDERGGKIPSLRGSEENEMVKDYRDNLEKYRHLKRGIPKRGSDRESMTLNLLADFKKRLHAVKSKANAGEDGKSEEDVDRSGGEEKGDEFWLAHELNFEGEAPVIAKDANMKTDDWFDLSDPRNPINKRRREKSRAALKSHH